MVAPLTGLPAYLPPGTSSFLHDSTDARSYWKLLREVDGGALSQGQRSEYLALHDVFYAFWPDVSRRRYYIEALLDLIESQRTLSEGDLV
ncbi:hypothetical protein EFK50_14120 [Nocardioides marmoriginsengisoli]|uniref:Uncharacterized protein n=2 Tax=Nocardioides marmoriginsengisoli TaxID=661483 RepID=A0A3N0CHD8_9ACTN|nr:hypothetical protein EFK50_14120 [Nocardioides marmoriginsengisoli]